MAFSSPSARWSKRVLFVLAALLALGAAFAALSLTRVEPILVGFLGTLSGASGPNGLRCADGALLAVEDCNNSGGIRDTKVQLELHDDQSDAAVAEQIVRALGQRGCWAIVGPTKAHLALRAAGAASENRTLLISPMMSTDVLKAGDESFASVRVSLTIAAENIARHLRFKRNLMRTALVIGTTSEHYFEGFQATLLQALATSGVSSAGVFEMPADGAQDYDQLAKGVLGSGGDNVLVFAGAIETALLVQHLRASRCELPIITYEPTSMRDLIAYGGLAAEGITVIASIDPASDSSRFRSFCDRFEKRFGRAPDVAAIHSYEATRVALLSIAQASQHDGVRRAMLSRQWFDGLQGRISMGSSGSPKRELHVIQLRNGTFTDID